MKEGWGVNGAKDGTCPSGVCIIAYIVVPVMNKADVGSKFKPLEQVAVDVGSNGVLFIFSGLNNTLSSEKPAEK